MDKTEYQELKRVFDSENNLDRVIRATLLIYRIETNQIDGSGSKFLLRLLPVQQSLPRFHRAHRISC